MNVDGSGEPYDNMLELCTDNINNLFGVTVLQNGIEKLTNGLEDAAGTKSNCKHNTPSHRKKRNLDKDFIAWTNDHPGLDEENTTY